MNQPDEITRQLDAIARLLEAHGYSIEVHYGSAAIIVWTDNWPVVLEIKRQKAKGKKQRRQELEQWQLRLVLVENATSLSRGSLR